MVVVGKGDCQRFVRVCGHKEKLSSFEERKKKEGKGASKKDVNHYLRKQAKEAKEPINTALAEAFSKIQLLGLLWQMKLISNWADAPTRLQLVGASIP